MRIIHVITRLIIGGAQENTIASVLGLNRKPGVNATLISGPTAGPEGSLEALVTGPPGLFTRLPQLVRPIRPWNDWQALGRLTQLFRAERPDIVHTHSGKAGILGRLAAARARVPVIIHTIHGPSFGDFQGPLANAAFRRAELLAGKVTTHFVTVADAMRDQYLAAAIGRPQQYTTVFSGFDLDPFLTARNDPGLRARFGIRPDDLIIGKIARLFPLKGHDDLIEIAPRLVQSLPGVRILLIGDGSLRQRLERKIASLGLQKVVIFAGLIPPAQIAQVVGIMDILVHLSSREGLPRALPQALAAARPVVAYDHDGAKEVCIHNQTGLLVPHGDQSALLSSLLQLTSDAALRQRLGAAGQEFVKARFPVQKMVNDLYSLYQRLR